MIFYGPSTDDQLALTDIEILGMCVQLAYEYGIEADPKAGRGTRNEIYWYTREKCAEKAKELGLGTVAFVRQIQTQEYRRNTKKFLAEQVRKFWPEVCHPDILIKEVLNS